MPQLAAGPHGSVRRCVTAGPRPHSSAPSVEVRHGLGPPSKATPPLAAAQVPRAQPACPPPCLPCHTATDAVGVQNCGHARLTCLPCRPAADAAGVRDRGHGPGDHAPHEAQAGNAAPCACQAPRARQAPRAAAQGGWGAAGGGGGSGGKATWAAARPGWGAAQGGGQRQERGAQSKGCGRCKARQPGRGGWGRGRAGGPEGARAQGAEEPRWRRRRCWEQQRAWQQ